MQKLDPELSRSSERTRDINGADLLAFLKQDERNTIVCCNNLYSLNTLSSSLKKALVKGNPNAVFYGNNELENFIADSLVDQYGEAFSELVGKNGVHNAVHGNTKTILLLKNGEKLDDNEITILRSLSEQAEPKKSKMIIFFNIGISAERIKQKIDIFGNSFSLYDAQDIKIQDDETAVSLSHDNELKKPIVQAADDIPTEKKDLGESIVTPKYGAKKLKIIFVLLLVVGFLLSLEEKVQTKIRQIIGAKSSGQIFFSLESDYSKRDSHSFAKNKFSVIYLSGNGDNKNSYVSG